MNLFSLGEAASGRLRDYVHVCISFYRVSFLAWLFMFLILKILFFWQRFCSHYLKESFLNMQIPRLKPKPRDYISMEIVFKVCILDNDQTKLVQENPHLVFKKM